MEAAYDWLNLVTALLLGKAGGIAGVLAILGMVVAVGVAAAQYEGIARHIGVGIVAIALVGTAWFIFRPERYHVSGNHGFGFDVPASFTIVDSTEDRLTLTGGSTGDDRIMFRTGPVPKEGRTAYVERRHKRLLEYARRRGGKVGLDITGDGFAFVSWTDEGQPDDAGPANRMSGIVTRKEGAEAHWASIIAVTQSRGGGRNRDMSRLRQSLCASAGLDARKCGGRGGRGTTRPRPASPRVKTIEPADPVPASVAREQTAGSVGDAQ